MNNWPIQTFLGFHIVLLTVVLLIVAVGLRKRGLFSWLSVGFWSWAAFALYFVFSPLIALISGNLQDYDIRFSLVGGAEHAMRITWVIAIGIAAFYLIYFRTPLKAIRLNTTIRPSPRSPLFLLWMIVFLGFGIYALLASRAGVASWNGETTIVGGRFTGQVTGYQNAGYMFMVYPTILLCQWPKRGYRLLGFALATIFVIFSIPHAWSRYVTISMLVAIILVTLARAKRGWPPIVMIVALLVVVFLYQARGHTTWKLSNLPEEIGQTWVEVQDKGLSALAESDTQMLPTFWVESYVADHWTGYNYGIPLINYLVSGWIPGRIFPQKYFLIDWLASQQTTYYPAIYDRLLYGAKSTLVGSFYQTGGLLAVIFEMAILGWLSRRVDGMLNENSPLIVQALGICWLSTLWMVWASSDIWGLMALGVQAMPYLAGVLFFFITPVKMASHQVGLRVNE